MAHHLRMSEREHGARWAWDRKALGAALEKHRREAGHENASAFARKLCVAPNTVYRIEGGAVAPGAELLEAWARECRVSHDDLVAGVPFEIVPASTGDEPEKGTAAA